MQGRFFVGQIDKLVSAIWNYQSTLPAPSFQVLATPIPSYVYQDSDPARSLYARIELDLVEPILEWNINDHSQSVVPIFELCPKTETEFMRIVHRSINPYDYRFVVCATPTMSVCNILSAFDEWRVASSRLFLAACDCQKMSGAASRQRIEGGSNEISAGPKSIPKALVHFPRTTGWIAAFGVYQQVCDVGYFTSNMATLRQLDRLLHDVSNDHLFHVS